MFIDMANSLNEYLQDMLVSESISMTLSVVIAERIFYEKELLTDVYLDSYIGHHKE